MGFKAYTATGELKGLGATGPAGTAGATTISTLTDVNLAGLSDGDILIWDSGTSKFIVDAPTLAALSDVNLAGLTDGDILIWDSGTSKFIFDAPTLAALSDVNLAGLTDGDILIWDSGTSKFIFDAPTIAALSDVNLTSLADGDILIWDAGTSKFINGTQSGSIGNIVTLLNTSDSLPVSPNAGDMVRFRDGLFDLYYDGTVWLALYDGKKIIPPDDADFTWVYQGTTPMASVVTVKGRGIHLEVANDTADQWYVMSQPIIGGVGQSWTLTACAIFTGLHMDYTGMGILARYSVTGDFVGFAQYSAGGTIRLQSIYGNNVPQLLGSYRDFTPWVECIWFRIQEDGTNRFFYFSIDGIHWVLYDTRTNTEHTTVDELGFGITARNGSGFGAMLDIIHWEVTYP